jgi:T5SS/PEP-CTERM-associated repeat protein
MFAAASIVVTLMLSVLLLTAVPAFADITATGDVDPADPSTWTSSTYVYIGKTDTGIVTVNDGSDLLSWGCYLGYSSGSTGTVSISGSDSTWTNGLDIIVGYFGSGAMIIVDGGRVNNDYDCTIGYSSNSMGSVSVSGAGSTWTNRKNLTIGESGSGELNIMNGGCVINSYFVTIGKEYGSTGTVSVSGAGSTWTNSDSLTIGSFGNGEVNITGGGTVNNSLGVLGYFSGSTGRVSVAGSDSAWINSDYLTIGNSGSGELSITDGGIVSNNEGQIGFQSGSAGAVSVSGSGSTWTNGSNLYIGKSGSGELDITDNGYVSNASGIIGYYSGSTGRVSVSGSTWTNNGSLTVGTSGSGVLNITDDGEVNVTGNTYVAKSAGSLGEIHFDQGTLRTASLWAGSSQLTGVGTIHAKGLIADDVDLTFDAAHGLQQTFVLNNQSGQNITVNLNQTDSEILGAGYLGSGTLTIRDGVTVGSYGGQIGYETGSTGMVNVSGANSTWNNTRGLTVGGSGSGELGIVNGGEVYNYGGTIGDKSSSTGMVSVSGAGSIWSNNSVLCIGNFGRGELSVIDGGEVSSSVGIIGCSSGSMGAMSISGAGSKWSNGGWDIFVGYYGSGELSITDGGEVSNGIGRIGEKVDSTGTVTVSGSGSTWTSSRVCVGYSGSGELNITGGGKVSSGGSGCIGYEASSKGTVKVSGPGSTWTNSDGLRVGFDGTGHLVITDGGEVSNNEGMIGMFSRLTSTVRVSGIGSMWNNRGDLFISFGGSGSGEMSITGGGEVINENGSVGFSSRTTGTVNVSGTNSAWTNKGDLNIGYYGHGELSVTNGGLVSVAGNLYIEREGDNAEGFINMATGGMLALAGDADDSLMDFLGLIYGEGAIRFWDNSISDWANITAATMGDDYTLAYLTGGDLAGYTLLTVGVVPEPGDANLDGRVDVGDLGILAGNYGTLSGASWFMGDFNSDGAVNVGDLGVLAGNYGYGVSTSAANIPEPATMGLLALGGLGLIRRKK